MQRRSLAHSEHCSHNHSGNGNGSVGDGARLALLKERKRRIRSSFQAFNGIPRQTLIPLVLVCLLASTVVLFAFYRYICDRAMNLSHQELLSSEEALANKNAARYRIPGSLNKVGDKSLAYAKLRQRYDDAHPDEVIGTRLFVESLHKRTYRPIPMEAYDIYNCPPTPPPGYPYAWNVMDVLRNWPTDDPTPRESIHQGLCVFDFMRDFDKALAYRNAELPFVVRGDPAVHKTVERWHSPGYMEALMGNVRHRTEYSANNHFMYWVRPMDEAKSNFLRRKGKKKGPMNAVLAPSNWTQPTEMMRMKYQDWLKHANVSDDRLGPDQPHWYYRLIGCGDEGGKCDEGSSEYLFDELTFFQPKRGLYLVEPEKQKGIHCRFGMKGVIAENHFDGSRNAIALLGGERRYILSHPNQCENLALYPKGHPSSRHSAVDWSEPDLDEYPQFGKAEVNEVVMQAGDVLYLPTQWFHYIVSLEMNFQCNTRSGISNEYMAAIHKCGF